MPTRRDDPSETQSEIPFSKFQENITTETGSLRFNDWNIIIIIIIIIIFEKFPQYFSTRFYLH